ncbi:MAG: glyoxylate/hydroxypyruvate reductase A [Rhodospirillales bacterium CG15_BIG_FIL_POST_REV_8_21_14_020_66_15]|nr:MAG: glyoxylate/hydroxypyruvate reductase A [Rhodospirillales bacterium CG15_BIG_FIL_POST_REV_8_21_14_020_66_15]
MPEAGFRVWSADPATDETGDKAAIDYAVVWKPEPGFLKTLPNLKAVFSMGAGVDHLWNDPELPDGVPLVRLVDRCLTQGMSEYVIYWVIHHHRKMGVYAGWAAEHRWKRLRQADAEQRRVGILGLGELGGDAAAKLVPLHYKVAGWARTRKDIPGVESFFGRDRLIPFLNRTEILVCLLPLTPDTRGILNAETLAALPEGACVINCARGGHVVDADLIAALDSGHIAGATLDVFHEEPLPAGHPFWSHPKVNVTPHMASLTMPDSSTEWYVENINRMERGLPPLNTVDRTTRY